MSSMCRRTWNVPEPGSARLLLLMEVVSWYIDITRGNVAGTVFMNSTSHERFKSELGLPSRVEN